MDQDQSPEQKLFDVAVELRQKQAELKRYSEDASAGRDYPASRLDKLTTEVARLTRESKRLGNVLDSIKTARKGVKSPTTAMIETYLKEYPNGSAVKKYDGPIDIFTWAENTNEKVLVDLNGIGFEIIEVDKSNEEITVQYVGGSPTTVHRRSIQNSISKIRKLLKNI